MKSTIKMRPTPVVSQSLAFALAFGAVATSAAQPIDSDYAPTHIYVKVHEGIQPGQLENGWITFQYISESAPLPSNACAAVELAIATALQVWSVQSVEPMLSIQPSNVALAEEVGLTRIWRVNVAPGAACPAMAATLEAFATHVDYATVAHYGSLTGNNPNDPLFQDQWALNNTGNPNQIFNFQCFGPDPTCGQAQIPPGTPDADIDAPQAWELEQGSPNVVVAVIDTGADLDHPDLVNKLIPGRNFVPGQDPNVPLDNTDYAHGSMVAGIIAAEANNAVPNPTSCNCTQDWSDDDPQQHCGGTAGVSWGSKIMPLKVSAYFSDPIGTQRIANALCFAANFAHDNPNARVIANMSIQIGPDKVLANAIQFAYRSGLLLVAAAGNTSPCNVVYPAADPLVMGVSATTARDELWCFSCTDMNGDDIMDLSVAAPGKDVVSTYSDEVLPNFPCSDQLYCSGSGTSFAAPHVAGLAALVWSANPSLTIDQVRTIIETTADDLGAPGYDPQFGHGRVNACRAVCTARKPPYGSCPADFDGDGCVGILDFLTLLINWGPPPHNCGAGDMNCDDGVGVLDFLSFLPAWGPCPGSPCSVASLQQERAAAGLTQAEWDTLQDCVTNGTQAQSSNCVCWMEHYLRCHRDPSCVDVAVCPGADPLGHH